MRVIRANLKKNAPDRPTEHDYGDSELFYKRPWKKPERKHPGIEQLCFYDDLNILYEALMIDGWATVDWSERCQLEDISRKLLELKESTPAMCFRAINRTTGRMMDFI
jgi:hypothetical protein